MPRSKAVYRDQITEEGPIYQGAILYLGQKTKVSSLTKPDTLHQHMGFKGLSRQPSGQGLAAIIDQVMVGQEKTIERVRELETEILDLANELSED